MRGHEIYLAASYRGAMAILAKHEPELLVIDNDLQPDEVVKDGLDAGLTIIRDVREHDHPCQILFCTERGRDYFRGAYEIVDLAVKFFQKK